MTAFYNEIDPYAAQWLRNLIAAGQIAPGVVDERSIEDITPEELRAYTQCHFFAGIGVWSFALRAAGWPDSRPIWTGSCPCQPFSAAGSGNGFSDERHLWPAFHHLIAECQPPIVLGEQVASSLVDPWIDLVHADLEAVGYAFGGVPFPSAGIGAPHIRDRLYWVADANGRRQFGRWAGQKGDGRYAARVEPQRLRHAGGLDHPHLTGLEGLGGGYQAEGGRLGAARPVAAPGESGGLADDARGGRREERSHARRVAIGDSAEGFAARLIDGCSDLRAGPTNGYWAAADWLGCRDGKWRPVEPGTFPLVNGPAGRVGRSGADWRTAAGEEGKGHRAGRLKGYGNAINAEQARIFVQCVMESL